jgi:hypothetical protein
VPSCSIHLKRNLLCDYYHTCTYVLGSLFGYTKNWRQFDSKSEKHHTNNKNIMVMRSRSQHTTSSPLGRVHILHWFGHANGLHF